jgi:hypothetical protein
MEVPERTWWLGLWDVLGGERADEGIDLTIKIGKGPDVGEGLIGGIPLESLFQTVLLRGGRHSVPFGKDGGFGTENAPEDAFGGFDGVGFHVISDIGYDDGLAAGAHGRDDRVHELIDPDTGSDVAAGATDVLQDFLRSFVPSWIDTILEAGGDLREGKLTSSPA